jgi:hypothetical protein
VEKMVRAEYAQLKPECIQRIKHLEDKIKKYNGEDVYLLALKRQNQ